MAIFTAASALFGISGKASSLLGIIGGNWKEALLAGAIAVIVYQNTFDNRVFFWADTIPYLRNLVHDQEAAIGKVVDANEQLRAAIERTNAEIARAVVITDKLKEEKSILEGELRERRVATQEQVRAILNAPVPQTCEAAIGFLRDMIPALEYDYTGVTKQ